MKKFFTFTLCGLLAISCSSRGQSYSKGSTMSSSVGTQVELEEGNRRITEFRQELLRQGFHEVSVYFSDSKDQFILAGRYGALNDLQVTLWTGKRLETKEPQLGGGIHASIRDKHAEQEFDELYEKVVSVVTGKLQ